MPKLKQYIRIYLWPFLIIILCCLIIYFNSSLNTCYGLIHGFGDLFLMLVLFLLLGIYIITQIYKILKFAINRKRRIVTILIVSVASTLAFQGKSTWKELRLGNSILSASIFLDQLDIGRIELLDDKKYYAVYGHIDWSCAFTHDYQKSGDTLILSGQPFDKSNGILANKYIQTDSTLIPINIGLEEIEIMEIKKKN